MRWMVLLYASLPLGAEESLWCRPVGAAARTVVVSGALREAERFERLLGRDLVFALDPVDGGGWMVRVSGVRAKDENWAGMVELPLRGNYTLNIDAWHFRQQGLSTLTFAPGDRRFQFVLNGSDYARVRAEREVLIWQQKRKPEAVERAMRFTARSACGEGGLVLSDVELAEPTRERILKLRFRAEFKLPR